MKNNVMKLIICAGIFCGTNFGMEQKNPRDRIVGKHDKSQQKNPTFQPKKRTNRDSENDCESCREHVSNCAACCVSMIFLYGLVYSPMGLTWNCDL